MKIKTQPIYPIFVLYSALNYNGYDKENNQKGMFSLRIQTRNHLLILIFST